MNYPLVSIITPIYNGSRFLDNAVKSVLNQTYKNWELFLIDDGSKDDSYEKAKKWSEKDKRIIALHHPNNVNKGVSATRNLGIYYAKGEYIAFLDCDDEWLPEKLEKQIAIMLRYPETVMTYALVETIDENGIPICSDLQKLKECPFNAVDGKGIPGCPLNLFEQIIDLNNIYSPCSTVLARKKDVLKCGGFDETLKCQIEDSLLFTLLAEQGLIFFLDEILARHRFHANSWSAGLYRDIFKRAESILPYFERLFKLVKPENRPVCSREMINSWIKFYVSHAYHSHPKRSIYPMMLSSSKILCHKDVYLKDKARCLWILMRWFVLRILLFPFRNKK